MVELDIKAGSPQEMMELLRMLAAPSVINVRETVDRSTGHLLTPEKTAAQHALGLAPETERTADEEDEGSHTRDVDLGEPKRRVRRTQAQIAADAAAQSAAPAQTTSESATTAQTASPDQTASTPSQPDAPSSAGEISNETINAAMKVAIEKLREKGEGPLKIRDALINGTKTDTYPGAASGKDLVTPELRAAGLAILQKIAAS